jgi:hypothetical protein
MLYSAFRFLFIVFIGIILFILYKKSILKTKVKILICTICLSLSIALTLFPFENLFYHFDSAESVFRYARSSPIVRIVDGSESSLVLYKSGETSTGVYFVLKDGNKYKICPINSVKKVRSDIYDSFVINIYHVNATSDYYLELIGGVDNGQTITIKDGDGKEYEIIRDDMQTQDIIRCVYSINYDPYYQLYINDHLVIPAS